MHRLFNCIVALSMVGALAACGSVSPNNDGDGGPPAIDAGPTPDADPLAPDAAPQVPPPGNAELTSGGVRVTGGAYTMDVMVGHPTSQAPASGGGTTIEGAAAIK